jgi:hypothetical protein
VDAQLLEQLKKQSTVEIHLHDVSPNCYLHLICYFSSLTYVIDAWICLQLRGALGTLMTEGAVVIHGDSVKRV